MAKRADASHASHARRIKFTPLQIIDLLAAMAELTRRTLTNIPFDLQIAICIFLRPIDILALRKVCQST